MLNAILIFILGAIWGSFLNFLAYRLINSDLNILDKRSKCISCNKDILYYDLIPIISWIFLKGKCRFCKSSITFLYPFIEFIAGCSFLIVFYCMPIYSYLTMCVYISSLILNIRTDLETFEISDLATIYIYPIIFIFNLLGFNNISIIESFLAAILGYSLLFFISLLYKYLRGKDGIGEGDFYLLALIGLSTGFYNMFISLFLGSFLSNLYIIYQFIYLKYIKRVSIIYINEIYIPFGAFLSLGSIFSILIQHYFVNYLFYI